MKSGSPGQKDLSFALELLGKVENVISNAGLNLSHKDVQDLGNGLATAKGALARMLGRELSEPAERSFVPGPRSMDPMKIALRVLTELAEGGRPHPDDLAALVRICGHDPDGAGWDEFACEALQKVLSNRAAARQSLTAGPGFPR